MSDIRRLLSRFGTPLFFLVLMVALIVVNSIIGGSQHKDWPSAKATITTIEEDVSYDADNHRQVDYHTYVKYSIDGRAYDEELGYYEGGYAEGKEVEIRYNPANPRQIEAADISSMLRYFKIMIPVAAMLFVLTLAWTILRRR